MDIDTPNRTWYDPTAWPTWLRWAALGPVPLAAAIAIYFVYNIVNGIANSFMPMMPTAIVSLIAGAVGAYMYVSIGRIVAPAFNRLAGFTLATIVFLFAGYDCCMMVSNATHPQATPVWYSALFLIVIVVAAVAGALVESTDAETRSTSGEVFARIPTILRWILFLPSGALATIIVGIAFGIMFWLLHFNIDATKLITPLVEAVTFIGVTSAAAPRGKGVIGISFASIIGLYGAVQLIFGIDRSLAAQVIAHLSHGDAQNVGFFMSQWYQVLFGVGLISGALIGATGAVEAAKARKTLA